MGEPATFATMVMFSIGSAPGTTLGAPTSSRVLREESSTFSIAPSDEMIEIDITSSSFAAAVPLLSSVANGKSIWLILVGDPSAEALTLNSQGSDEFDEAATSLTFHAGAKIELIANKGSNPRWMVFTHFHGNDSNGNLLYGAHWTYDFDQPNDRPRIALGNLSTYGFSGPGGSVHIVGAGVHGLRIGDNFAQAGGNSDWILRANEANFGEGTLELLYLSADNREGGLKSIGNGAARVHMAPMDGGFIIGAEADSQPFEPGEDTGFMIRSGGGLIFEVDKAGAFTLADSAFQTPTTGTPGTDADLCLEFEDENGASNGFVAFYATKW